MSQAWRQDSFSVGTLRVHPRERVLEDGGRQLSLEPLVMRLLIALAEQAGRVVTRRELFEHCWGAAGVGDDSLNRLVAALRRQLGTLGSSLQVETVPATGYVLKVGSAGGLEAAGEPVALLDAARDSWRLGLPRPDHLAIEQLRVATRARPGDPRLWGWTALLCRHAAEYGAPDEIAAFTAECEAAAREALRHDPAQPEAMTALATLIPLFGEWARTREALLAVLALHPDHLVATQDLATLEMATGRVAEGKHIRDGLLARDPLAAVTCYKSVYQHWSIGDRAGMDRVAERAISLWPTHPAVWAVRLWTYAYSGRPAAALDMTGDHAPRPDVPPPMLAFLRAILRAAVADDAATRSTIIEEGRRFAATGPAAAVASLFALGLAGDVDGQFEVLGSYYLHEGVAPVPSRHTPAELSLNEQHRRLTQVLFTPVLAAGRGDPRFMALCETIGLADYWNRTGLAPDFLGSG